jgi:predicted enzyme related to lactoylglutathione lyase
LDTKLKEIAMQRVIGIGGIFIKSRDPKALQAWYVKHLGLPLTPDGYVVFSSAEKEDRGYAVWSAFPESTTYLEPSTSRYMINFRVADLDGLLSALREEGVQIVGEPMYESYGKFGWILDPEGNKIELWEPVDEAFEKMNKL